MSSYGISIYISCSINATFRCFNIYNMYFFGVYYSIFIHNAISSC